MRLPPRLRSVFQTAPALALPLLLTGAWSCNFKHMLPSGPVLDDADRSAGWGQVRPSGASYESQSAVPYPVLPLLAFGLVYDVDIVLMSEHPEWNMHEYFQIPTPEGPIWLFKDSREGSLEQYLVSADPRASAWLPELAVVRQISPATIEDRSDERWLDLDIRYENPDGQAVHATFRGKRPVTQQKKRNGSTMGHSRNALLAVLDLSRRDFAKRASVRIDGEAYRLVRFGGIVPAKLALSQVGAGLSVGSFVQRLPDPEPPQTGSLAPGSRPDGGDAAVAFVTVHTMPGGTEVEQLWELEPEGGTVVAVQRHALRAVRYHFIDAGGSLELSAISVDWASRGEIARIEFAPALPDFRRRFVGPAKSRYVIDVNGQRNFAVGQLEASWNGPTAELRLKPDEPPWTADRPMITRIRHDGAGSTVVHVERTPVR
jgi:hypothetical protein